MHIWCTRWSFSGDFALKKTHTEDVFTMFFRNHTRFDEGCDQITFNGLELLVSEKKKKLCLVSVEIAMNDQQ